MGEQTSKRPHDVFISYASENEAVADAIVADFEQNGIRCWYAPRDIRAGANYMDALVGAIKNAEVIVLVYSDKSNESKYVLREISIAFEEGKTIVPFRLDNIQMGDALSFCLKGVHWMDATTPPLLKNITKLREHICSIVPETGSGEDKPPILWWVKYRIPLAVSAMVVIGLIVWFAGKVAIFTHQRKYSPMKLTDTWEEIIKAGNDGTYKEKYLIGDTKELNIDPKGVITMKLVAMDEDDLTDGSGKAHMTWVADELLPSPQKMNKTDTNKGGWEESLMRKWLREEILPLMPAEVRNNIREVYKYSYSYEGETDVISKDTIWIPSTREVSLSDYSEGVNKHREDDGAAYKEVFKDNESRIRRSRETVHSNSWWFVESRDRASSGSWWWLRSAISDSSVCFDLVSNDGSFIFFTGAGNPGGVVVGFCL